MTIEQALNTKDSILIGSRGLKVNQNEEADYDIAIKLSDLPNEIKNILDIARTRKYFSVTPLGNMWLVPKFQCNNFEKIDWIIFENEKDFKAIEKAMNDLFLIPKYFLKDKSTRVALFESALKHYGFK